MFTRSARVRIGQMSVYEERRQDLERYEFMLGRERGRLAVSLDCITDALVLVGQHAVYCQSARQLGKPAMDIQLITKSLTDAKELIASVLERQGSQNTEQGWIAMHSAQLLVFCYLGAALAGSLSAQHSAALRVKSDEIGGVVTSAKGPEAGVWVIAETTSLPTRYIKEVVTDDQGRYLIPALPPATYTVWARGYGLLDSPKVEAHPGKRSGSEARLSRRTQKPQPAIIQRTTGTRC